MRRQPCHTAGTLLENSIAKIGTPPLRGTGLDASRVHQFMVRIILKVLFLNGFKYPKGPNSKAEFTGAWSCLRGQTSADFLEESFEDFWWESTGFPTWNA